MKKIKFTADGILEILKGIFGDEDINYKIEDINAPEHWRGKTVQEVLNVEYYTFKHRPVATEQLIEEKMRQGVEVNQLAGLSRSFCLVSLDGVERLYSKDMDMATLSATMEYWIQTSKIKFLEELIENCNIMLSGVRIPVTFGNETRQAVIIFERVNVTDIQPNTAYGEMAICEINVNMLFYPDVASYKDYEVEFTFKKQDGANVQSKSIPLSSFSFVNSMTQKAVPYVQNKAKVGSINLSCANSFVLVFDGYNNEFIDYIIDKSLRSGTAADNNETFIMIITRKGKSYPHEVVIKDHQVTVNSDTGNETHTLTVVTGGKNNGIA